MVQSDLEASKSRMLHSRNTNSNAVIEFKTFYYIGREHCHLYILNSGVKSVNSSLEVKSGDKYKVSSITAALQLGGDKDLGFLSSPES